MVSVTEGVGDGNESVILEAVLEAMAEEYSRQLSQNVRRGLHETALKGNSVGGTLPLGYRVKDKKLVVDEHEAEIVRYIFSEYAAGIGKKQIIEAMNARGWRTRRGVPFTMNAPGRTLTNKKYIGVYTYNGEVEVEGGIDLISERVVAEYTKGFNSSSVKALESELREIDRELNKLVDALIKTESKTALAKINDKIAALEARKESSDLELVKLRVAANITITPNEVKAWLRQFCKGDPLDEDFCRRNKS